ncbi:MAG: alcohol dehydrogenase catalytic domain-containing protein [Thermoanaerobaculia bacterium]
MKAVQVRSLDDIALIELPVPEPGEGEILVRMKAVGLCGSDVSPWYVATKAPAVLGHETAGIVERVGTGDCAFAPGDRVFVHHHAPCGTCRFCLRGDSVMCADWKPTRLHPGGLAEFVRVEKASVLRDTLKLPPEVGFDDAVLIEPVACGIKAVDRGEVAKGDTAAVLGLGSNGILLGELCRHAGAAFLVGSDPDPSRRKLAEGFGFDLVLDPAACDVGAAIREATGSAGADAVFVIPTLPAAATSAIAAAGPAGRVVFYSPIAPQMRWEIAPHDAYFRDLTIRFSYSCGPAETRRALALIARGVIRAERLITHRLPLAQAAEGFRLAAAGGSVLKVLIEI